MTKSELIELLARRQPHLKADDVDMSVKSLLQMMGSALAHYAGIKAFSETDQTDDLKAITVPTLVLHGDDDQIVPYENAAVLQAQLLPDATLKLYEGYPHGMLTVNADVLNADILAFIQA